MGCRTKADIAELVRVARMTDGTLEVDRTAPGRGAWLCRAAQSGAIRASCLDLAQRRQAFQRAFRLPLQEHSIEVLRGRQVEREKMDDDVASEAT